MTWFRKAPDWLHKLRNQAAESSEGESVTAPAQPDEQSAHEGPDDPGEPDDLDDPEDGDGMALRACARELETELPKIADTEIDMELERARFADLCRAHHHVPFDFKAFATRFNALDEEGRQRLALLIALCRQNYGSEAFSEAMETSTSHVLADRAFFQLAGDCKPLTPQILLNSELRREEFLRVFAVRLGVEIRGESREASLERLSRLDFKALLDAAGDAESRAKERAEYLKRLHERDVAARVPRGKG